MNTLSMRWRKQMTPHWIMTKQEGHMIQCKLNNIWPMLPMLQSFLCHDLRQHEFAIVSFVVVAPLAPLEACPHILPWCRQARPFPSDKALKDLEVSLEAEALWSGEDLEDLEDSGPVEQLLKLCVPYVRCCTMCTVRTEDVSLSVHCLPRASCWASYWAQSFSTVA